MTNFEFILLILYVILLIIIMKYKKKYSFLNNTNISPQNRILFLKLQKQYLNNVSFQDINELIVFLFNFKNEKERKKKK